MTKQQVCKELEKNDGHELGKVVKVNEKGDRHGGVKIALGAKKWTLKLQPKAGT